MRTSYKYPPGYNSKEQKEQRKRDREGNKVFRETKKQYMSDYRNEVAILKFMLKTDVIYYHHGQEESLKDLIKTQLDKIQSRHKKYLTERKKLEEWGDKETYYNCLFSSHINTEYHPYYWNYNKDESSHIPLSYLGRLWYGGEFETIYDVPLDGSYIFYTTDSGARGLGSMDYLKVRKSTEEVVVYKVNPGAIQVQW